MVKETISSPRSTTKPRTLRSSLCKWNTTSSSSLVEQSVLSSHLLVGLALFRRQPPELLRVAQDEVQMPIKSHEPVARDGARSCMGPDHIRV